MLNGLMGPDSTAAMLKAGLDASSARARGIASRVANASDGNGFQAALNGGAGGQGVNVEKEMVSLADEQIRYAAMTSLLQKVYTQVRASVQSR